MVDGWNGERQKGTTIDEIEFGHVARYNYTLRYIIKDHDVLDAACGCGYGTNILAQNAKRVVGVDYSNEAIEYAKRYWSANNIEFLQYDLNSDNYDKLGKFDIITSFETIEHLPAPILETILKFRNILKKDGLLILSHPEDEPSKFPGAYALRLTFHFHFKLKGDAITQLMQLAGFDIKDDWYQSGRWGFPYHIIVGRKIT